MPVRPGYFDVVPPSLNLTRSHQEGGVPGTQQSQADYFWAVPTGYYAYLVALTGSVQLVGTAGNRQLLFQANLAGVDNGAFEIVSSGSLTANAAPVFAAGPFLTAPSTTNFSVYMPLPPIIYTPGSTFSIQVQNNIGADQIVQPPVVVWNLYLYDSTGDDQVDGAAPVDLTAAPVV